MVKYIVTMYAVKQFECQLCGRKIIRDMTESSIVDKCYYCSQPSVIFTNRIDVIDFNELINRDIMFPPQQQFNDIKKTIDVNEDEYKLNEIPLDIIKNSKQIKLLSSTGYLYPIDDLQLIKYEKEYPFAQKIEEELKRTPAFNVKSLYDQQTQMTSYTSALYKKILSECEIQYSQDIQLAYYDIETVECDPVLLAEVPQYQSLTSRVKMIQYKIQNQRPVVMLLNNTFHIIDQKYIDADIIQFQSEQIMVSQFIDIMRQQRKQTIWLGFNSSSQAVFDNKENVEYNKTYGYDLAWLMNRSMYRLTPQNKKIKLADRQFLTTCKIQEIPMAYFYDMQIVCHGALEQKDLRTIKSYSLQSYAEVYGYSKQEDHSYSAMRQRFLQLRSDITQDIVYGIQDIVVLEQIQNKINWLTEQKEFMNVYNLGLYATLYETHQERIQILINREMIKQNRAPAYYKPHSTDRQSYKGADTGVDNDYACKVLQNVIQNDFNSLYSSIIIHYNISPETLIYGGDEININFNDDNQEPEYVSFDKTQQGILPQLCQRMITERTHYKKLMNSVNKQQDPVLYGLYNKQQLTRKVIGNTIYGAEGAQFQPQFNIYIAKAITAGARMALDVLKKKTKELGFKTIAWDTDAVNFETNINNITYEQAQQINKAINNELQQHYGNNILKTSCDEVFKSVVFARAKKSYARLELDANGQESIVIKGISWASINPQLHEQIKNDAKRILTKQISSTTILRDEYIQQLQTAVSNYDLQTIYKWGDVHKTSNRSSVIQFLKQRRQLDSDKVNVFYTKRTYFSNKTSSAILDIEIDQYNVHTIDIGMHVDRYIKQLDKIFTYEKQTPLKQALMEVDENDNNIIFVRCEQEKQKPRFLSIPLSMLRNEINNNPKISFHEILRGEYCKLFFDIDTNQVPDPVTYIAQRLADLGYQKVQLNYATAHAKDKRSWHIVSNLWMHKSQILTVYKQINNDFDNSDFIDMQPIKNPQGSLRLPNTIKIDNGIIVNRKFIIQHGSFQDMLITNPNDTICILPTPCSLSSYDLLPQYKDIQQQQASPLTKEEIKTIESFLKTKLKYDIKHKQQLIPVTNINCPLRDNNKKNHGCYVLILPSSIEIRCHGTHCNKKVLIELREIETIQEPFKLDEMNIKQDIYTQNNKYVQYDITQTITAVQSHLGTGKTEQLIKYLQQSDDRCVILSTRIAYAQNVKQRFNDCGIDAVCYKDIQGVLVPKPKQPIIVQFESLQRLCENSRIELLVLDEWLSILEQINANLGRQQQQIIQYFYELIKRSDKILVLDGLLTRESIAIIEYIKQQPVLYINNRYSPYTDYNVSFHQSKGKGSFSEYKRQLIDNIKEGKKVICYITEKQKLYSLIEIIKEYTDNIKYVTGDDLSDDHIIPTQKHRISKYQILGNFQDELQQCQVFLFTSAITSGVDFSLQHFDIGMHYVKYNSGTPNQCIQAMFRVRHLKEKHHILYYHHANIKQQYKPYYLLDSELHQHIPSNIKTIAESFNKQIQLLGEVYVYQGLKQIGLNITIVNDKQTQNDNDIQRRQTRTNRYCYGEAIPDVLEQYIQAQQYEKNKMVNAGLLDNETAANEKINELYQFKICQNLMTKLNINMKEFFNEHKDLTFKYIEQLIRDMKSYDRLSRIKDCKVEALKRGDIKSHYQQQLKMAKSAIKDNVYTKKQYDQIKEDSSDDLKLHQSLVDGDYHILFNSDTKITPEVIAHIKLKCRQVSRGNDSQALCRKLGVPNLNVKTQRQYIHVFYDHYFKNR